MTDSGFTVSVFNHQTGEAIQSRFEAASEMLAVHYADSVPLADWSDAEPTEIFTLEVSDHGRSVDSTWSSLPLAQAEAQRIHDESEGGLNQSVAGIVPASFPLTWESEQHADPPASRWQAVTYRGVSGQFGFTVTRTVLDVPRYDD